MLADNMQRHVLHAIFPSLCIIGFVAQFYSLAEIYFRYSVSSEITIEVPVHIATPDATICFTYIDLLDYKRLQVEKNITIMYGITPRLNRTASMSVDAYGELTIAQIFEYTPKTTAFISSCWVRATNDRILSFMAGAEYNKLFTIRKVYTLQFICYRIQPSVRRLQDFQQVARSLRGPGTIYWLQFSNVIFQGAFVKTVMHNNITPWISTALAPYFQMTYSRSYPRAYLIDATYANISFNLLPPPYESNCHDYSRTATSSREHCHYDCLERSSQRLFGKSNYMNIIDKPLHSKHLSEHDFERNGVLQQLQEAEKNCSDKCSRPSCRRSFTVTRTTVTSQESNHRRHSLSSC